MSRVRRVGASIVGISSIFLVSTGLLGAAGTSSSPERTETQASVVAAAYQSSASSTVSIAQTTTALSRGEALYESSKSTVLDESVRNDLSEVMELTSHHLSVALAAQGLSTSVATDATRAVTRAADRAERQRVLSAVSLFAAQPLVADRDALNEAMGRVSDSVTDYEKKQKEKQKQKQEREAAAQRQAQEAENSASEPTAQGSEAAPTASSDSSEGGSASESNSQASTAPAPRSEPAGPADVDVSVRQWIDVATVDDVHRAQDAINAGGQIAVNYQQAGVVVVSAHNYYDSTALGLQMGQVVHLHGALSGDYTVVSETWVGFDATSADLAAVGTSVAMQTCGTDTMRIVGLRPL